MDLYIHNLSPDLCDSNNEASFIASKVLGDVLSKSGFFIRYKSFELLFGLRYSSKNSNKYT